MNIFNFVVRARSFSTSFIGQLGTGHKKLVQNGSSDDPQSIADYMEPIDPVRGNIGIKIKDDLAIIASGRNMHAIGKEKQIITDYRT